MDEQAGEGEPQSTAGEDEQQSTAGEDEPLSMEAEARRTAVRARGRAHGTLALPRKPDSVDRRHFLVHEFYWFSYG